MAMGDFAFSMQMRDTINRMVKEQLDKERPRYRYATVKRIDRLSLKCDVIYNGEANEVRVNMGSIQPSAINQVVRVEGIGTDKFITDVLGQAWNGHRYGTVEPYHTNGPVKVKWTGDVTYSGPYNTIVSDYRPRGNDTVIGIEVPGYGLVVAPAVNAATRTYDSLKAEELNWLPLDLKNGWRSYSDQTTTDLERYSLPRFTKTRSGIVKVQGLIKGGTTTVGTLIATLPEGYRPAGVEQMFPCQNANTGYLGGSVDIKADGRIVARSMSAGYHSLDQITFPSADAAPNSAWTPITFSSGWTNYNAAVWTPGSFWVDPHGIVWERGLVKSPTGGAQPNGQVIATGMPPPLQRKPMHRTSVQNTGNTAAGIYKNTDGSDAWIAVSGTATGYVSLDAMPYVKDNATAAWFPFTDPVTFTNGWSNYDTATYPTIGCYKTSDGLVVMSGLAKGGSGPNRMFLTPPGCRPRDKLIMMAQSALGPCRLDMYPDGWWEAGANWSPQWTSVDSQAWIADH